MSGVAESLREGIVDAFAMVATVGGLSIAMLHDCCASWQRMRLLLAPAAAPTV
jgi:hypothetical protein